MMRTSEDWKQSRELPSPKCTAEFKQKAVKLHKKSGATPPAEVAHAQSERLLDVESYDGFGLLGGVMVVSSNR